MTDLLLYLLARPLVALLQRLPLRFVATLGRIGGRLAFRLDKRHRTVAIENLAAAFGSEKSAAEIRALAKENFIRIGENYATAIKTAAMTREQLEPYVHFEIPEEFRADPGNNTKRLVVAIGHFGNFELYARFGDFAGGYQTATTYRALRQPSLNRMMQAMREKSGCHYFERRQDASALKSFMNRNGIILGLLADQHAGENGLRLPFLGRECSTSAAPAIFALRYRCALYTGICYRVGPAQWRLQAGKEIPTHQDGKPRSPEEIMLDVNQAFELAVRQDPANWFWVHKRWKPLKPRTHGSKFRVASQPAATASTDLEGTFDGHGQG